jgi:hypothetical protein
MSSIPSEEQTSRYWQWIYSFPKNSNPLRTGEVNKGDYIMLPCTGGGEDCNRHLDLRLDDTSKSVLIPVFCCEYSTAEVGEEASVQDLLETARDDSRYPTKLECVVDGVEIKPHYVESKPFKITVPAHHMLDNKNAPPGTYTAISAGYWCLLHPLVPGQHRLKFGGSNKYGFNTKVEYVLNVPTTLDNSNR